MQTILIGVSSGIAAFKAIEIVIRLKKRGYNVIVIMTENAKKMISPSQFKKASGNKVASELFPKGFDYKKVLKERRVEHITLADRASVICVVPATANIIAKLANGIADDLLTTTILASKARLLVCPSMNVNMWRNETTSKNISILRKRGTFFIPPEKGMLACGYEGTGRLANIEKIEEEIIKLALKGKELSGKKIIVTSGGTEEEIDDVRVITNKSSGKMGIAIAEECAKRGAKVTLIRARTEIEPNVLLNDIKVTNAKEMLESIKKEIRKNNVFIHAAAISDFTVLKKKGKIKSGSKVTVNLIPTVKIIDKIKKLNNKIFLVGFKAESGEKQLIKNAMNTLKRADADMIIANDISKDIFGTDENEVIIINKKGDLRQIKRSNKNIIAEKIVNEIADKLK